MTRQQYIYRTQVFLIKRLYIYLTLARYLNQIGNITYNSQLGSYTYGAKPHAVIQAGANSYTYDANGNMTQRPNQTITYDYDNRPVSINGNTFIYDYAGQRIKKNNTIYIGKLYECTAGTCTKYIFAGSSRIASKTTSATYYFHTDHLGSSSVITDTAGNKVQETYYYPFGGTRLNTGNVVKHKYTGQEEDPETGLYYYNARYYDPMLARFISADSYVQEPDDPQSFNRYSYTRNNPLIYTDPTGNWYMNLYSHNSYSGGGGGCSWCSYDPWYGSSRRQQESYWDRVSSNSGSSSSSSSSSTSTSSSSSSSRPTPAAVTQVNNPSNYSTTYLPRTAEYFGENGNLLTEIYAPVKKYLGDRAISKFQEDHDVAAFINVFGLAAIDFFLPQEYYQVPLMFMGGGLKTIQKTGQLAKIWGDSRLFKNWIKGNQSLSRINNPLSHSEARQIIENAQKHGLKVDLNPTGLQGMEKTGQWANIPHFKVENVHIPIESGFKP